MRFFLLKKIIFAKYYSQNSDKMYCHKFYLLLFLFFLLGIGSNQVKAQITDEEAIYDAIKLEIMCRAIEFSLNDESGRNVSNALDCQSITALEATIPEDFRKTIRFFRLFKDKRYASYGKNKLDKRLTKLIKDIETELLKLKRNDVVWQESVKVLVVELNTLKDEKLSKGINSEQTNNNLNQSEDNTTSEDNQKTQNAMVIYFIIMILTGAVAFAIYQNMQLKKQIAAFQEEFLEKYSRLDNRIDTMTPIRDYKSLTLRINYINEQIGHLAEQISILQSRNALKMTPEELFAKRTEHLEQHYYNPDVQVYYAKPNTEGSSFKVQDFRTEPSQLHFFKLEIDLDSPQQALYSIVNRDEYHHWALENLEAAISPFCELANQKNNPEKIINVEEGFLDKQGNEWKILKKLKISLE